MFVYCMFISKISIFAIFDKQVSLSGICCNGIGTTARSTTNIHLVSCNCQTFIVMQWDVVNESHVRIGNEHPVLSISLFLNHCLLHLT